MRPLFHASGLILATSREVLADATLLGSRPYSPTICYEAKAAAGGEADIFAVFRDLLSLAGAGCIDFFSKTDIVPAAAADPERLTAETGRGWLLELRVLPLTEEDVGLDPVSSGVFASMLAEGGLP